LTGAALRTDLLFIRLSADLTTSSAELGQAVVRSWKNSERVNYRYCDRKARGIVWATCLRRPASARPSFRSDVWQTIRVMSRRQRVRAGNGGIPRGADAPMATRPVAPGPVPDDLLRGPLLGEPVSREAACRLRL